MLAEAVRVRCGLGRQKLQTGIVDPPTHSLPITPAAWLQVAALRFLPQCDGVHSAQSQGSTCTLARCSQGIRAKLSNSPDVNLLHDRPLSANGAAAICQSYGALVARAHVSARNERSTVGVRCTEQALPCSRLLLTGALPRLSFCLLLMLLLLTTFLDEINEILQ